jgi:hypothetical protein
MGSCARGIRVLTSGNTVHCKGTLQERTTRAAVPEIQSADLCNTVHCKGRCKSVTTWQLPEDQEADSVTQCTAATLQRAQNKHGSCVRGSEC